MFMKYKFRLLIEKYKIYSGKRYSTIAGTLVYFLLMSITPFFLWLTLVLGNMDFKQFFALELFDGVRPLLSYLKQSAESAASGAGIILLATSLYSSTNFFFHLRRSGEIIYDSPRVKGGIKLRLISLSLIILLIALIAFLGAVAFAGSYILDKFLPEWLSDCLACIFITIVAFAVALILNIFACPYKIKLSEALTGSLLTTCLWLFFSVGFVVYLYFASPEKLYGKIASIIIFLLWCYIMMCCFVIGMINNGTYMTKKYYKKLL